MPVVSFVMFFLVSPFVLSLALPLVLGCSVLWLAITEPVTSVDAFALVLPRGNRERVDVVVVVETNADGRLAREGKEIAERIASQVLDFSLPILVVGLVPRRNSEAGPDYVRTDPVCVEPTNEFVLIELPEVITSTILSIDAWLLLFFPYCVRVGAFILEYTFRFTHNF